MTTSTWTRRVGPVLLGALGLGSACHSSPTAKAERGARNEPAHMLPSPKSDGPMSLEAVLRARRSQRRFGSGVLTDAELAQLLWAAQGITDVATGARTAPSAGALHPLTVHVVDAGGVWRYDPKLHRLLRFASEDRRDALARAALDQPHVRSAATALVLTASPTATRAKYGARAERYLALEAGHAAQNVLLQATALGLAAVVVGAFDDDAARRTLGLKAEELPLYVVCVGRAPR